MAYTYTNRNTGDTIESAEARPRLDALPNWDRTGEADQAEAEPVAEVKAPAKRATKTPAKGKADAGTGGEEPPETPKA